MDFDQILDQAIEMLQRRGRLTYRSLKRQFQLDAETLDDLKFELIEGQQIATDEKDTVLVWTGSQEAISQSTSETPRSTPTPLEQGPASYTPPYLAEKILTSRSALEGERKQVTVLFADIKDSTEFIRDLDPEDAQKLLDPAIHIMMEAVHRFEGTVNQVLGDGIMSIFGAPIAHEDHAARACYAALAMQTAMQPFRLDPLPPESADALLDALLGNDASLAPLKNVMQGDAQQAIPRLERSRALCRTNAITLTYPAILIFLSLAYALSQRDAEAHQLLDEVMPHRAHFLRFVRPAFIEAMFLVGRVEEALTDATEALDRYLPEQSKSFRADIFRLLGDIHASQNPSEVETPETYYHQALTLANDLGMRPLQAHCHRSLGTLYSQTGQVEQARAALTTAIEMYRDMEMTFWLPETEAALAAVEGKA